MKLLKDGDRIIYRYPGDFTLASSILRMLPAGFGVFGAVGIYFNNSEWDSVLLIPLGICAGLVFLSIYTFLRALHKRMLPQITQALIFEMTAGRMYLSPDHWRTDAPLVDLSHLPSYGFDQFRGWDIREYTVSRGNDRMSRSTFYVVTLRKTDGGYFDVLESGFEPRARAVLRELASEVSLNPDRVTPAQNLPLPPSIQKQEKFQETLYTWNKAFSFGSYASGLFFVSVAATGFFFVIGSIEGEYADLVRLSIGGPFVLAALIIIVVGVTKGIRASRLSEYLLLRRGALEYGEVPRDEAKSDRKKAKETLDLTSVVKVRYDRALDRRNVTALWFQKSNTDQGLFLALDSLSEGEAVILEQSLENEIRRYGGTSE